MTCEDSNFQDELSQRHEQVVQPRSKDMAWRYCPNKHGHRLREQKPRPIYLDNIVGVFHHLAGLIKDCGLGERGEMEIDDADRPKG